MSTHGSDYDSRGLLAGLRAGVAIEKAMNKPRAGEHDGLGPHITKFGSIKEISGKLEFHDFEVDCEGAQIGILTSFMTRLIVTRLLTNLEQEFAAERDLLRERERELVEALTYCEISTRADGQWADQSVHTFLLSVLAKHGR